ncbi:MAG: hypothetical protein IH946_06380 [Bacteroidetes bacterium]|nr:hypothetical protein [Bacteroidota bacterium]
MIHIITFRARSISVTGFTGFNEDLNKTKDGMIWVAKRSYKNVKFRLVNHSITTNHHLNRDKWQTDVNETTYWYHRSLA